MIEHEPSLPIPIAHHTPDGRRWVSADEYLELRAEYSRLKNVNYQFQQKLADGITDAFLGRSWIAVSERLPEEGKQVLCSDDFDGWIEVLQHESLSGWVDRRGNEPYAKPTHWMPMPVDPPA